MRESFIIETIVRNVAKAYNVDWQSLFCAGYKYTHARHAMINLMIIYLGYKATEDYLAIKTMWGKTMWGKTKFKCLSQNDTEYQEAMQETYYTLTNNKAA